MTIIKKLLTRRAWTSLILKNESELMDHDLYAVFSPLTGTIGIFGTDDTRIKLFDGDGEVGNRMWYIESHYYPVFDEQTDEYTGSIISGVFYSKLELHANISGHLYHWTNHSPWRGEFSWLES